MEAGTVPNDDVVVGDAHEGQGLPPAVKAAAAGRITSPGEEELDASAWLLDMDFDAAPEIEPTLVRVNVGTPDKRKIVHWYVVPLPGDEFRKFRQMATGGNRAARRATSAGQMAMEMDDGKYHLYVVTAATVNPDLRKIAQAKQIADPAEIVKRRFIDKPGLIAQISGVVSDISGYDENDVEVAAGNS